MSGEFSRGEWRYQPGGTVKHLLGRVSDAGAICGVDTLPASNWRGTGSQDEYERLETLRPCRRCLREIT